MYVSISATSGPVSPLSVVDLQRVVGDHVAVQLYDGHVGEHWSRIADCSYLIQFTNDTLAEQMTV